MKIRSPSDKHGTNKRSAEDSKRSIWQIVKIRGDFMQVKKTELEKEIMDYIKPNLESIWKKDIPLGISFFSHYELTILADFAKENKMAALNYALILGLIKGIEYKLNNEDIDKESEKIFKTKTIETTEKYDKDGKLVEKIIVEETLEGDMAYESGAIYYPKETAKSCHERKCELSAEDIIKAVHDYTIRTGKSPFLI